VRKLRRLAGKQVEQAADANAAVNLAHFFLRWPPGRQVGCIPVSARIAVPLIQEGSFPLAL
jgi:hypothetical protein